MFGELRRLDLPLGEYAVVGSAVMQAHGLRQAGDIDLVVSQSLYQRLHAAGWQEKHFPGSDRPRALFHGPFDASIGWSVGSYRPDPARLIAEAELIGGLPFVRLEELRAWKATCRREKDLRDLGLIAAALDDRSTTARDSESPDGASESRCR